MIAGLAVAVLTLITWYWWEKRQKVTHPMPGGIHTDVTLPHEQEYEPYHRGFSTCLQKVRLP